MGRGPGFGGNACAAAVLCLTPPDRVPGPETGRVGVTGDV